MTADPRFPIGPAPSVSFLTPEERRARLTALRALPDEFVAALAGLTPLQLDTPYREGGWTLRQLAHHVPDSHLNAFVRTKLALTEDEPVIKPYEETRWAELPDSRLDPASSLELLRGLHVRWAALLENLPESGWRRRFLHPVNGPTTLDAMLAYYAWHGQHHTAHLVNLRQRRGW